MPAVAATTVEQDVVYSVSYKNGTAHQAASTIPADENAPVITLNGAEVVELEYGAQYVEAGATAVDFEDGDIDVVISGEVDVDIAGFYTITYTATDAAGNVGTETRIVVVAEEEVDTTAPVDPIVNGVSADQVTNTGLTPIVDAIEGVTVSATLTKDGTVVGGYNLGDLISAEGEYELTVTATKTSNSLTAQTIVSFTIDTTVPTLEIKTADGSAVITGPVQLTGTDTTYSFRVLGEENATIVVNDGSQDLTAVNGVYTVGAGKTVTVTATDASANFAANSFEVKASLAVVTTMTIAPISVEENKTAEAPVVSVLDQFGNPMTDGYTLGYSLVGASRVAANGTVTGAAFSATPANNLSTLTVTVTPTTGTALTANTTVTVTPDVTAPAIQSVTNVNGNQLVVVFSEKVGLTNAIDLTNYKLQNTVTGSSVLLNAGGTSYATLGTDGKTLTITLSAGIIDTAGIGISGLGSLDAVNYRLFVNPGIAQGSNIFDIATTANRLPVNSYLQFTGVIDSDTQAPMLKTASLATGAKQLTLSFNEKAYAVDVTKVTLTDGTTTFALATGDTANVITYGAAATTIVYTIGNAASIAALTNLNGAISVEIAAGAIKDVVGNEIEATTMATTALVNPALVVEGTNYNEDTHKLTVKFNKVMDVKTIADFSDITLKATGGTVTAQTAAITADMTLETTTNSDTIVFALGATAVGQMQTARANNETYTIALAADTVKDAAGNDLGVGTGDVSLTYLKDEAAPTVESASFNTDTNILTIKFNEAMAGTTTNPAAGSLAIKKLNAAGDAFVQIDAALNAIDDVDGTYLTTGVTPTLGVATWDSAGKVLSVLLTNAEATAFKAYDGAAGRYIVFAAATLADINTNVFANTAIDSMTSIAYTDDTAPSVTSVTAISETLFEVNFDKEMNDSIATPANYTIVNNNNANITGTVVSVEVAADKKSALLTLSAAVPAGSYKVAVTNVADSIGNLINATANFDATVTVAADTAVPTMASVAYTDVDGSKSQTAGDKITVTFNEPVTIANGKVLADIFQLDLNGSGNGGDSLGTGATIASGSNSKELVVTLGTAADPIDFGTSTLFLVDSGLGDNTAIEDLASTPNNPASGVSNTIDVPSGENVPVLESAVFNDVNGNALVDANDTVVLTFDQVLAANANFVGNGSEAATEVTFTDSADNTANVVVVASAAAAQGNTVTLALTSMADNASADISQIAAGAVKVAIANASANITNQWGQSAGTTAVELAVAGDNEAAPYLVSVTKNIDGSLEFVYSEEVYVDGTTTSQAFVSAITAANELAITNGVFAGHNVTPIAYKQDPAGNDIFTTIVVTADAADVTDEFTTWVVGYAGMGSNGPIDITGATVVRKSSTAKNIIIAE